MPNTTERAALDWAGLAHDAPRETIIDWLIRNDRNGCYSDEDLEAEGWGPLTRSEALENLVATMEENT